MVLLSGDTHYPQVTCIPGQRRAATTSNLVSYALAPDVEFEWHAVRGAWQGDQHPVFGVNNLGVMDFDLTGAEPQLRFNIVTSTGKPLYAPLILAASELRNGVASWQSKTKPQR